jgi:thioredoxin 1
MQSINQKKDLTMSKIVTSNPDDGHLEEIINNHSIILCEVRADWCGGSHIIAPVIKKIEDEFNNEIKVVRVAYDTHKEFLYKFNVNSIPVVLLIKDGKLVNKIDGTISRENLKNLILELLNNHNKIIEKENYL